MLVLSLSLWPLWLPSIINLIYAGAIEMIERRTGVAYD